MYPPVLEHLEHEGSWGGRHLAERGLINSKYQVVSAVWC